MTWRGYCRWRDSNHAFDAEDAGNLRMQGGEPSHAGLGAWPDGGDETVAAGQVSAIASFPPAVLLGEHPVDGGALLSAVLDRQQAAWSQQEACRLLDNADRVEAVLAAPEGGRRVVLPHLGRHPGAGRDVGRVAND